jgi:integrase
MKRPGLRRKGRAWYYDAGGKPRRWVPLGSNEATAIREYDKLANRRSSGTVGRMLQDFILHLRLGGAGPMGHSVSPATLSQYDGWQTHLQRVFGAMRPDEVTQADVLLYLVKCPRTSARGEIGLLSGAYRFAMLEQRITFNPCIGVRPGTPRARRDRYLTHAEYDAIYRAGTPRLRLWLDLAYVLALRVDDVCSLRWDQFEDGDAVRTQKTGARQRFVLADDLRAILNEARALHGKVVGMYVIPGYQGNRIDRQTAGRWFRAAAKAGGIEDARPQDIRAKAATDRDAEQEGAATRLLGHQNPQTTRTYLRGKKVRLVEPMKRRGTGTM